MMITMPEWVLWLIGLCIGIPVLLSLGWMIYMGFVFHGMLRRRR